MRPTLRGATVLVAIAAGGFVAVNGGREALNAVIAPLVVAGVAAIVIVGVSSRPSLRRRPVAPGYVGERRRVSFELTARRGTVVTVTDELGRGLEADGNRLERVLSGTTDLSYDLSLRSRGVRSVGPLTVTVQDPFGLVTRRYRYDETEPVVVYPPVYELRPDARAQLEGYVSDATEFDRAVFEHLREYERGDSLRDVHWKSAAKRPDGDLVVKEFVADDGLDRLTMAGTVAEGDADDLAAALATLADHLFEMDVGVVLWLPGDRRVEATPATREEAFLALAELEAGSVAPDHREDADIVVDAAADGVVLSLSGRSVSFADLCAYETSPPDTGSGDAISGTNSPSEAQLATGGTA
ncbi:hypothetical protein Halru_2714 [Halovivax ruber XH-70]|uniref:Uncharacterized protein n=1 Tax=Halovivax ruber (strain DSM 18193 / JCM 13892 / XH-70) TaxID=797302 RepID=L0IEX2_HALRX|nr:DUF58 domain-containing protein [Halovivax ruber]AGB17289.1 hypothetical protein Halru_2714 [Halovivax ruber XH-70]